MSPCGFYPFVFPPHIKSCGVFFQPKLKQFCFCNALLIWVPADLSFSLLASSFTTSLSSLLLPRQTLGNAAIEYIEYIECCCFILKSSAVSFFLFLCLFLCTHFQAVIIGIVLIIQIIHQPINNCRKISNIIS